MSCTRVVCPCRRQSCICGTERSFWINVYPAEGGAKVAGLNLQVYQGMPQRAVAEQAITHLAKQERLVGRFVAIYRHCFGQETSHSLLFTAAEQTAPIVAHFAPKSP
jgi:hypothetical protein